MPTVDYIAAGAGSVGPDFVRRYTRGARVQFASGEPSGPKLAILASGFAIGASYATGEAGEADFFSFCIGIDARVEVEDVKGAYLVTAQYGPWEPCGEDPTLNPVEVEIDHADFERIVDEDVESGEAIVNSAGDPFDPPVTADDSRMILTFTRNEQDYDANLADEVRDTLNAGGWRRFGEGTVKAKAPKATRLFHPLIGWYWRVTYTFHVNRDGWDRKILDAGMRQKASGGGQSVILSKDKMPVSTPVPLDGSGHPLPDGSDPEWLTFRVYRRIDFSIFNLDDA
ncbi:MAG: hypothetical protein U0800_26000 [Isosphaeraceae bacterium]